MPDVIIKGMEMRSACSGETDCFALDERGDYPMCRITGETRGYTFPIRERRMDNCPLSPAPKGYIDGNNLFSRIAGHSYYHGDAILSAIQCAIEGKESHESIPPADISFAPEWINVDERLPKTRPSILGQKSSKVIVAFQFDDGMQGTDTAHILNGDWIFEDRITVVNRAVTHWMPLPEPPKDKTRI